MTAEKVAEEYEVSREAQDEYAARSHQRAAEATESGRFDDEIVPVETDDGLIDEDEGIRPDTTAEKLSGPRRRSRGRHGDRGELLADPDGASLTLVTSKAFAEDHGLSTCSRRSARTTSPASTPP